MKLGPILIIKCPNCDAKYKKFSLMSGNTLGAKFWTDGKMDAPMLPQYPKIKKCNSCSSFFWIEDAQTIERVDYFKSDKYKDIDGINQIKQEEMLEAINSNIAENKEREKYLRIKYWHLCNDAIRTDSFKIDKSNESLINNLKVLIKVLDEENQNERIIKAEIYRELDDFDNCINLLDYIFDEKYVGTVEFIKSLAQQQNNEVKMLNG